MTRTLRELVGDAVLTAEVDGFPWQYREVTFDDSLYELGPEATELLMGSFMAHRTPEGAIDTAAAMRAASPEVMKTMILWQRKTLELGCINPRICQPGEAELYEPPDGEVARIRYDKIPPKTRTALRALIEGKEADGGKSSGS